MSQSTPLREFVRYSALSSCGMIAVSCYILADTFFVAQGLGTAGLAALNLAIPIYNFIHGTGLMLGMGGATKYSIHQSRGNPGGASRMFTGMLLLSVLFSIPFLLLGLFCSHGITVLLGADQAVFEMTRTYLQVLLLFAPATLVNDVLLCFVRNDGDPRLSMLATAAGSLANIVLDYIFIFPMGMGIFGAVLATGMSPVLGILILLPHCIRKKGDLRLVPGPLSPGPTASALSLGLPSLLAQLSSAVVMIAFNSIILGLEGNTGVAAYGVIANISLVVTAVYTGISQGIQPLVSTAHGQDRPGLIRQYLRYALITLLVLSAALYLLLFLFAGPVALIFNSEGDPRLQQIAEEGLRLYFTGALCRVQHHPVHVFHLGGAGPACPYHLPAAGFPPDPPHGLPAGRLLGHDGRLAGLSPHRSRHRGPGRWILRPLCPQGQGTVVKIVRSAPLSSRHAKRPARTWMPCPGRSSLTAHFPERGPPSPPAAPAGR